MFEGITSFTWEDFHFLRPAFLWLLLPALATLVLGLVGLRENIRWKKVLAAHLRPFLIHKGSEKIRKRLQWLLFTTISLAVIGLAGPTWRQVELPGKKLETPLVIILDLTPGMLATDIQPSRLERAKFKIMDLMKEDPGARIALIGYSGTAHVVIPLTRDYNIISSHVSSLTPEVMPVEGNNLEAALQLADTATRVTNAPGTVLIFTADVDESHSQILQQYVANGKNKVVVVPMNTKTGDLKRLSAVDGIDVNALTLDNSDMELLARGIRGNLEFQEEEEEKEDDWQDEGLLFVIPFTILGLFWFRKGWVIYGLFIGMVLTSCSGETSFKDLWLTKDYQAQQLYNVGEYGEAAEMYSDPMHQGVAYYKSGNYQKAIEAFERDTTAAGAYNLGLAYYQNGDFQAAELAFGQAAELDPGMEDAFKKQAQMKLMVTDSDGQEVDEPTEAEANQEADNLNNTGGEDLSGGGQEATEEDMKKERKEETATTDMRTGKELEELPPDFQPGKKDDSQQVLMRKVDDDPGLFLKRKFKYQAKNRKSGKNNN